MKVFQFSAIAAPGPFRTFAYGSPMWNPGFGYRRRERTRLDGFRRARRVGPTHVPHAARLSVSGRDLETGMAGKLRSGDFQPHGLFRFNARNETLISTGHFVRFPARSVALAFAFNTLRKLVV